jgi:hypothetical protein
MDILKLSCFESQIPSSGKMLFHSFGLMRYFTSWMEDIKSSATKVTTSLFLSLFTLKFLIVGRELSMTKGRAAFSAVNSIPEGLDGLSEATTFNKYTPSGRERVSKA